MFWLGHRALCRWASLVQGGGVSAPPVQKFSHQRKTPPTIVQTPGEEERTERNDTSEAEEASGVSEMYGLAGKEKDVSQDGKGDGDHDHDASASLWMDRAWHGSDFTVEDGARPCVEVGLTTFQAR